ncbi:MAG: permease-like cell division protein FtsX [bacterium]|nr:permease-like cell division protein FtsX [bacterium]
MSGARKSRPTTASILAHWRAHHGREARDSLRRFASTPVSATLTVLVVALALSLPVSLLLLLGNAGRLTTSWDGQAQVSLYLRSDVSTEKQNALQKELGARKEVSRARLITPALALDEFRQLSGYGEALNLLDSNPLPAVIVIQPADIRPDSVKQLRDALAGLPEVEAADIDLAWVQRLAAILKVGQRLLLALAGALAATVLLVIGNTIRLDFESRKEEVQVLKLLGATDAFVRRPFLYSGLWTGLAGGLLACLMVAAFFLWLDGPVSELAKLYSSTFRLNGLNALDVLVLLAASTLLGISGAWLAVNRHLKAMEP